MERDKAFPAPDKIQEVLFPVAADGIVIGINNEAVIAFKIFRV